MSNALWITAKNLGHQRLSLEGKDKYCYMVLLVSTSSMEEVSCYTEAGHWGEVWPVRVFDGVNTVFTQGVDGTVPIPQNTNILTLKRKFSDV